MLPDIARYERYIELTNGRVRYYEAGSGDDHTLLLHGGGLTASADSFQFVLEPMAEHLHVYALDNLGSGKSDRALEYGPTFDVVIDGFREFMDLKGIGRANVVGNGAGGWLGTLLAYESPDRVAKLVLLASAGMDVTPIANVRSYALPSKEVVLSRLMRSVYEGSAFTREMAEAVAEQEVVYAHTPGAFEGRLPIVHQMDTPEIRRHYLIQRRLPFIQAPVLMMWAKDEAKDPYPTWVAEWEELGGDMTRSSKPWVSPLVELVRLPDETNPLWESPVEFAGRVARFIKA